MTVDLMNSWKQYEISFPNDEIRKEAIKQIVSQLKSGEYYFNQYFGEDHCFIKLGMKGDISDIKLSFDENTEIVINSSEPDLRLQGIKNPIMIDDLKSISTQIAVEKLNLNKLEIPQIFLIIHFLMNQLGYSYWEEIFLYSSLIKNISRKWIDE